MQTCSKCNVQSADAAAQCVNCQADLRTFSNTAVAVKRFQSNPRVTSIRVAVAHNRCPACLGAEGTYIKDKVPSLPVEGCSHDLSCRCFYEPVLNEIYP